VNNFLCRRRWFDVPVSLSILWPHKLAVVIEDHPAVGVSHYERERSGVFEMRQMIGRERVSKRVVRPFVDASGFTGSVELLRKIIRRDVAGVFAHWQQPLAQVRLNPYEASPCRL